MCVALSRVRVDRFQSGDVNEYSSTGFRLIWTAAWVPQRVPDGAGNYESKHQLFYFVLLRIQYYDTSSFFYFLTVNWRQKKL